MWNEFLEFVWPLTLVFHMGHATRLRQAMNLKQIRRQNEEETWHGIDDNVLFGQLLVLKISFAQYLRKYLHFVRVVWVCLGISSITKGQET